jgi:helix-turn-helix protein
MAILDFIERNPGSARVLMKLYQGAPHCSLAEVGGGAGMELEELLPLLVGLFRLGLVDIVVSITEKGRDFSKFLLARMGVE